MAAPDRPIGPGARSIVLSPELAELSLARCFVGEVAREAGFSEARVYDITLLTSEAAANAIEHAPVKGTVEIKALLYTDRLEVQVKGPGEFQTPDRLREQRARGLGLPLMAKLSDHLALYSAPEGGTLLALTFYREGHGRPRSGSPLPPSLLELFETGDRLEAVFGAMPEGFAIFDRDLRCVYLNEAIALHYGRPKAELLGARLRTLEYEESQLLALIEDAESRGGEATRELRHAHLEMWSEVSVIPFAGGFAIFSRDVTDRRRSEEALKQTSLLLDLSTEAIFAWELDGPIRYWNSGAEKLYGYSPGEAVGSVSHDLLATVFPRSLDQVKDRLGRGGEWMGELSQRHRDGHTVEVESRMERIEAAGVSLVLESDRDVTERKRVEEVLKASEARYDSEATDRAQAEQRVIESQKLFDSVLGCTLAATALYRGSDLTHQYANPAHEALRPGRDILGKSVREVWPELGEELEGVFQRVLQTGERYEVSDAVYMLSPVPGLPPEPRRFTWSLDRIHVPGEEGWSLISTAVETTAYERALRDADGSRLLAASEKRMAEAQRVGHIGSWEWDLDTGVIQWSRELYAIYGVDAATFVPSTDALVRYLHPDDRELVDEALSRILANAGPVDFEFRIVRDDGSTRVLDTRAEVTGVNEQGKPLLIVGVNLDVTDKKQTEAALRESEERYRILAQENERLYRQQLDIAEKLQVALLNIPSEIGRVRVGHLYRSATETARVGGDFYDVFEVKGGLVCVLVGDVAGHGIEAARTATLVKDVIHAFAHQSVRPQEVLRRTNALLVEKDLPGFVTLFLGVLDSETGEFRYASAGHPSTFLRRAAGEIQVLGAGSAPLGIHPEATWKAGSAALEAGDLLLLYTDGVIEARRSGEYFGEKRLETLLKRKRISAERLPHIVLDQVLAFSGGSLSDDVAVLALSLTDSPAASARPAVGVKQGSLLE